MILDRVTGPISSPLQIVGGFGTTTTYYFIHVFGIVQLVVNCEPAAPKPLATLPYPFYPCHMWGLKPLDNPTRRCCRCWRRRTRLDVS
jgi:hypothetical protein